MPRNAHGTGLRILTWHVHGSYLYYLSRAPHRFFLPVDRQRGPGYVGRTPSYSWPDNVQEVDAAEVRRLPFDAILYQSRTNWETDQHRILSEEQKRLPRIYLEHDPPREHPTDTRHPVDDPEVLLVHVTDFNRLMWDNGRSPVLTIDHGVAVPEGVRYTGENERGLVVVNHLRRRGRRLGADLYDEARRELPLDLVGMGWDEAGGIGEVPHHELPLFSSKYRFLFNPIRYTSLGLAVCEAMMLGMPIVGLATTEMATTIENGYSGYLFNDVSRLKDAMRFLLSHPIEARRLGDGARRTALERFSIDRFVRDWNRAFAWVSGTSVPAGVAA